MICPLYVANGRENGRRKGLGLAIECKVGHTVSKCEDCIATAGLVERILELAIRLRNTAQH